MNKLLPFLKEMKILMYKKYITAIQIWTPISSVF